MRVLVENRVIFPSAEVERAVVRCGGTYFVILALPWAGLRLEDSSECEVSQGYKQTRKEKAEFCNRRVSTCPGGHQDISAHDFDP